MRSSSTSTMLKINIIEWHISSSSKSKKARRRSHVQEIMHKKYALFFGGKEVIRKEFSFWTDCYRSDIRCSAPPIEGSTHTRLPRPEIRLDYLPQQCTFFTCCSPLPMFWLIIIWKYCRKPCITSTSFPGKFFTSPKHGRLNWKQRLVIDKKIMFIILHVTEHVTLQRTSKSFQKFKHRGKCHR